MPMQHQPEPLLQLAYDSLTEELIKTCRYLQQRTIAESPGYHILALARAKFRPFWTVLPGKIRSLLLERCANQIFSQISSEASSLGIGPGPLYLLTLLLAPDINHLRVDLCCYYGCTHQILLLTLLREEGMGLESIELARSALLRLDCRLLQSALQSMTRLKNLTLRNIASDGVLKVIGSTCHFLSYLDVEHSRQVTDAGINSLLLNIEVPDNSDDETNNGKKGLIRKMKSFLSPSFRRLSNYHQRTTRTSEYIKTLGQENTARQICESIRTLKIANTGVSYLGVLIVLRYTKHIESLGEYCHLGRVLEMGERILVKFSGIQINSLKYARTSRTTQNRIDLLANCCPRLVKLCVTEPLCCPQSFTKFSLITSLQINSIRNEEGWIQGFYTYLSKCGEKLKHLTLRFFPSDIMLAEFDVSAIVANCPGLKSLTQDGAFVFWGSDIKKQVRNLEKVQLGKTVSLKSITNLISAAPNLKIFHIYGCEELGNKDLSVIVATNIECFYIYESKRTEEFSTLIPILLKSPQLRQFGWLRNWGISQQDVDALSNLFLLSNLDMSLTLGSHWYCSECFPFS